jgi:hypothetical protein
MSKLIPRKIIRFSKEYGRRLAKILSRLFPLSTLPKRATLKIIRLVSIWISARPSINRVVSTVVNHFPMLKIRLKRLGYRTGQTMPYFPAAEENIPMSSEVRTIYLDLVNSMKKEANTTNAVKKD